MRSLIVHCQQIGALRQGARLVHRCAGLGRPRPTVGRAGHPSHCLAFTFNDLWRAAPSRMLPFGRDNTQFREVA